MQTQIHRDLVKKEHIKKEKYIDRILTKQKLLKIQNQIKENQRNMSKRNTQVEETPANNNLLIRNPPALISIMPLNQHFLLSALDFSPHKHPPFIIINKL
jgi:hypothetical protein